MNPDTARAVARAPHGGTTDPGVLDFSANTNPVIPPGVPEVYEAALSTARAYPAEPPAAFVEAAAASVGCDPDAVIPTAGGMEAIRLAIALAVDPGATVLVPAPSFGEYAREVRLHGGTPVFTPYDAILEADPMGHAMAIVCNPNNPTGDAYDAAALRSFVGRCRDAGVVVLVDEAFLDFTRESSLAGTPGVVVARSLTKIYGLPGLRAGFAVAVGRLGGAVAGVRPPWNLSGPAVAVGVHCLEQSGFVAETRERVRVERARMRGALEDRYEVHPSEAPFVLLDVGDRDVDEVLEVARAEGVVLRDARTFRGLDAHIRVAVRLPTENDRVLGVLAGV